jgi:hypothetical protein
VPHGQRLDSLISMGISDNDIQQATSPGIFYKSNTDVNVKIKKTQPKNHRTKSQSDVQSWDDTENFLKSTLNAVVSEFLNSNPIITCKI